MNAPVVSNDTGMLSISMMLQLYPLAMLATSSGGAETASLQFGQAETGPASTIATRRRDERVPPPNASHQGPLTGGGESGHDPGDEDKQPHSTSKILARGR